MKSRKKLIIGLLIGIISVCIISLIIIVLLMAKNKAGNDSTNPESPYQNGINITYNNNDSVAHPSKESIEFDQEENIIYFKDTLIVYTFIDLDTNRADEIAKAVDGVVVGKVSGAINAFQIRVKDSSLDELNSMADSIMGFDEVLYAGYDYPIELSENNS